MVSMLNFIYPSPHKQSKTCYWKVCLNEALVLKPVEPFSPINSILFGVQHWSSKKCPTQIFWIWLWAKFNSQFCDL